MIAEMFGSEMQLFPELLHAYREIDRAVMEAYGLSIKETTESSYIAEHIVRYQTLATTEGNK